MLNTELFGLMIGWLLAAIVLSLLLWMLVLIWGQMLHTIKTWFGLPREPLSHPLSQPHEHEQVPMYPGYSPLSQDGYTRRDVP